MIIIIHILVVIITIFIARLCQANNTPQLRNAALLARINQMRMFEAWSGVYEVWGLHRSMLGFYGDVT